MPPAVELLTIGLHYCIRKAVHELLRIFSKQGFFSVFSLYIIINIAGRIREAAMGGEGGAQQSILPVKKPKKDARSARARTHDQNPLVAMYFDILI